MSATYRIETTYEPSGTDDFQPFIARVYRLSDDEYVTRAWAEASDKAEIKAREWIAFREGMPEESRTSYVDDQGRDAEAPQSVKV
jgi:hypothetical protein